MRRITYYIMLSFILVSLYACAAESNETFPSTELPVSELPNPTEQCELVTEAAEIEITAPDLSINISAGAHCDTYTDEITGDYLDYYLFVPENAVKNMPLIVFLHGDGEAGNIAALENYGMMISAREIYGEDFPFIALFPNTREYSWVNGTIPETLKGLIDSTVEACETDPEHIILTGHSRGAIGTWYMISKYGDYFSAAVPVSCGSDDILVYENMALVPIWGFVGNGEQRERNFAASMQSIAEKITNAGGYAEITVLEGRVHQDTSTEAYTIDTFEWMMEQ